MEKYKKFENKIWNAITGLTSGVLTSLIYDIISNTAYTVRKINNVEIIESTNGGVNAIISILALFFSIWIVISVIVPRVIKFLDRFRFKKIKKYRRNDLAYEFELKKNQILKIKEDAFDRNRENNFENILALSVKNLAIVITDLHRIFYPANKKLKKRIRQSFRSPEHSSIITLSDEISGYEFSSLLSVIEEMVDVVIDCGINDELLKHDSEDMKKMLGDLRKIVN